MSFWGRIDGRRRRLAGASLMLPGAIILGASVGSRGEDRPPQTPASLILAPGNGASTGDPSLTDERPANSAPDVRYNGTPTPGSRITIGLMTPPDPETSYQWSQVEGPPATIDDPTRPKIQVTIPTDARTLGFLLTMSDPKGRRTARFSIPVEQPIRRETRTPIRADAGDDQIGLVGRRITLNGSGSVTARERSASRWFQLGGPKVEQAVQENHFYTFTPTSPGVYRFGLVVASADASTSTSISEMDEVLVTVGELPTSFGGPVGGGVAAGIPGPLPMAALDQMIQGPGSIGARATLDQVAGVLESIATRTSLYTSFADLTSEMMRRLDGVIPADPNTRQFWAQGVFAPMTQHMVSEMLAVGLDLRMPQAQHQPLGAAQQDKLQKLFNYYSREFRSRTQAR
jgi:hypothetical protein